MYLTPPPPTGWFSRYGHLYLAEGGGLNNENDISAYIIKMQFLKCILLPNVHSSWSFVFTFYLFWCLQIILIVKTKKVYL